MSTNNITLDYHKCHHFQRAKFIIIQGHFFIKIRWHQEIDFAGNTCKKWMQNALRFLMKKKSFASLRNNFWSFLKKEKKIFINGKKTCIFHQKSEGILHLLFAGNTLKFERLKISSEIKGNFKLDGNVLEIALQLYSALRFERLKRIHLFKNQGQ